MIQVGERHTILHGDMLDHLRRMPDNIFDLTICSPPYEAARTYGIDYKLKGQEWVDWCVARYLECVRVTRGLVVWVVEGQTSKFRWSAAPALLMADLHRAGVGLRKPPIFHRIGIPGSGGPDWWRNDYEFCICSSKGKLPWSDNTATGHPPKWGPGGEMSHRLSDGTRRNQWGHSGKGDFASRKRDGSRQTADRPSHVVSSIGDHRVSFRKTMTSGYKDGDAISIIKDYTPPPKANPGNVIHCKVGGGKMGSKLAHENEAPFPEEIVSPFVLSFCPPNGLVLDCFGGSGTTAAVCELNGRQSVSIDVRASQIELIRRRIEEAQLRKASAPSTSPEPPEQTPPGDVPDPHSE